MDKKMRGFISFLYVRAVKFYGFILANRCEYMGKYEHPSTCIKPRTLPET